MNLLKNKKGYLLIFVIVFIIVLSSITSCTKVVEEISSNLSFNYPGLRIETLGIDKSYIGKEDDVIICLGDSVTFGWNIAYKGSYPYILKEKLDSPDNGLFVINSGIGGDTVLDAYERIDKDVLAYIPDLVILSFGLNDGMLMQKEISDDGKNISFTENDETFYTRLSLESFRNTYSEIIDLLIDNKIEVVLLTTNPVMMSFPNDRTLGFRKTQNEIYDRFNKEIRGLAIKKDIELIDVKKEFESNGDVGSLIQPDGLHPNAEGLEMIAEIIANNSVFDEIIDK